MEILVAYDVATDSAAGRRRLRKVANICIGYGQRVQKSVFECSLTPEQLVKLEHRLLQHIDPEEDSLRLYRLSEPLGSTAHIYGRDAKIDLRAPLVV